MDEAIANTRKIHSLPHGNLPVAHLIAGMAWVKKERYSEAAAEYRMFLEEAPNSTSADRIRAELDAIEKRAR